MNWNEFFAMGGHGFYIWGVYIAAAVVLGYNALAPILRRRAVLKQLRNYYRLKSKTR